MTAIWWIRRDLRLSDNQALAAALGGGAGAAGGVAIPVFVLDPRLLRSRYASERRLSFLLAGLEALAADLRARGSALIVRQGDPVDELASVMATTGATAIYAEEDHSPYARHRDAQVAARLPLRLTAGVTVHPPGMVAKADGSPYTVYTPFSKAWKLLPDPAPLAGDLRMMGNSLHRLGEWAETLSNASIFQLGGDLTRVFPPGESEARRCLYAFTTGDDAPIYRYGEARNLMGADGTSGLSPYLRFGMISARQAVAAAQEAMRLAPTPAARQSAETWLNELIWREFFIQLLYHFPAVRRVSFRLGLRHIPWVNGETQFDAWRAGRTGYPVVDAAMRQLAATGWMHNRARMIVASFLTKDLLIDWQWGEQWFMQRLIDGDPAANNGGWQWAAGTGADAVPYFRVFNPALQGLKFDPLGAYVCRWVPELSRVPIEFIHEPWKMPWDVQKSAGCQIGRHYPQPIVDHAWARDRALAAYRAGKTGA